MVIKLSRDLGVGITQPRIVVVLGFSSRIARLGVLGSTIALRETVCSVGGIGEMRNRFLLSPPRSVICAAKLCPRLACMGAKGRLQAVCLVCASTASHVAGGVGQLNADGVARRVQVLPAIPLGLASHTAEAPRKAGSSSFSTAAALTRGGPRLGKDVGPILSYRVVCRSMPRLVTSRLQRGGRESVLKLEPS